jgi:hypothetical protein
MANRVIGPNWTNLGGPVSTNMMLLTPSSAAAYYRIQGQ